MKDSVTYDLGQEEMSPFHRTLLTHCNSLLRMSRGRMANYYDSWDRNASVYKGLMAPDKEDRDAVKKGDPAKMTVPLTFAQVQTFVAFCFLLYTQNSDFYALQPTGNEDFPIRDDAEKFLKRDLNRNQFYVTLYQFLLDIGRFNLGVFKHSWHEDYAYVPSTILKQPAAFMGVSQGRTRVEEIIKKVLRFEGNKIFPISPFRFYPDLRLPITRFQEGEFCGSEDEFAITELHKMQDAGDLSGVEYVNPINPDFFRVRVGSRFSLVDDSPSRMHSINYSDKSLGMTIIDEIQVKIVPSKFMLDGGEPLGDETYPIVYNVWIANDKRIVKCEPLGYLHGQFTYDVGQFSPDQHEIMGQGLSDVIDHLQAIISWFVNSHISSVRKVISNRLVVDPAGIDRKSLEDKQSAVIFVKKGKSASGIDRWIKQLEVRDVTQNHMKDTEVLTKLMQVITGVNDNAMGQYNSGRRSATEARAVTAGAASRLKTSAIVIWAMALDPLGRKLLTNLRQGIQQETFARVIGRPMPMPTDQTDPNFQIKLQSAQQSQMAFQQRWDAFKSTPEELVGADDFFVFDSTLPSEKGFIAQSLQELLSIVLTNPESAQALDLNAKAILDEIYKLRGIPNFERFSLSGSLANQAPRVVSTGTPPALPPIIPITQGQPQQSQTSA